MSYVTLVFQKLFGYSRGEGDEADAPGAPRGQGGGLERHPGEGRARRLPGSMRTGCGPRCSMTSLAPVPARRGRRDPAAAVRRRSEVLRRLARALGARWRRPATTGSAALFPPAYGRPGARAASTGSSRARQLDGGRERALERLAATVDRDALDAGGGRGVAARAERRCASSSAPVSTSPRTWTGTASTRATRAPRSSPSTPTSPGSRSSWSQRALRRV